MYFWHLVLLFLMLSFNLNIWAATILPAPRSNPISSWLGNSFGDNTTNGAYVQEDIVAAFVGTDGTVYTNSPWDEGGHEGGIYKSGQMLGAVAFTHGHGRTGG